jgi:UDP-GlcNAc:undecaprenyl-phosphate GlcNAc-1-phosphate transferase
MTTAIFLAGGMSFVISFLLTRIIISIAPRIGFVDKPGHRKIHHQPKPLGGGVAIVWTYVLMLLGGGLVFASTDLLGHPIEPLQQGLIQQRPLLFAFVAGILLLHVMGLMDDKRVWGPYLKLSIQLLVTASLVAFAEFYAQSTPSLRLRVLTALDDLTGSSVPSFVITILWIVAITNAFNFLDNMDGLSAGVAVICGTAFMVTALSIGQLFVAGALAVFIGSTLGFLAWNFPPARIFMGDSGSLVLGFILGVLTVRTTYLPVGEELAAGWYAVFVPVIVLALPLYDLIVVSIIRLSRGKSPFVGDTNHFSHRLVARGMSRRTAVLCIYLVTFATSIAAVLLPEVKTTLGACLIFAQTLLVLGVVAILEQHPLPHSSHNDSTGNRS